jgi:hypothetical protein
VLPAFYWMATLVTRGADVWVVAGSETRAQLDEFLPGARAVIGSIDFDSSAVVASPPAGSEPIPFPSDAPFPAIGARGFGEELRHISAGTPAPIVTAAQAVEIAAATYLEERGTGSPMPMPPMGVVRRLAYDKDWTGLRSAWIVAVRLAGGQRYQEWWIDDQTGEVLSRWSL